MLDVCETCVMWRKYLFIGIENCWVVNASTNKITYTHKESWEHNKNYTVGKIIINTIILCDSTPLAYVHVSKVFLYHKNDYKIVTHPK